MMPRRSKLKGPSKAATAPEETVTSTPKTHLRTYSRRALKRRHTSPPAQHIEQPLARTGSLDMTGERTDKQRNQAGAQPLPPPGLDKGSKRAVLLRSAKDTANDLAWEVLTSSSPVLTPQANDSKDEGVPGEAHTVKCSPGQKRPEHELLAVKFALDSAKLGRQGNSRRQASSEDDSPGYGSLEASDGVQDGSSIFVQDTQPDGTALTFSSEDEGITIPRVSGGRFLVFDSSPPEGFKVLHKPRVNPDVEEAGFKRKRLTDGLDGFTKHEARPTFFRKRRRLQHLDINIGSLDMTQTSIASPQKPKNELAQQNSSPDAKPRPRTRTATGLWRNPRLFGTSQFEIGSEDSVVSPEVKITPTKRDQLQLDSLGSIIVPRTDSPRPKKIMKMESPGRGSPELVQDSSPCMRSHPNQSLNGDSRKVDSLALRPGPSSRIKADFVITNTILKDADKEP